MKSIFSGLDRDIAANLQMQLAVLWTHSSNALEGSTLTLGDTDFVIREGLTVAGKPLKDHKDAEAHYHAISLIYEMLSASELTQEHIFSLHRAIAADDIHDIYKPRGAWKNESNGTYVLSDSGQSRWIEYADPYDVPRLMKEWLAAFNAIPAEQTRADAVAAYTRLHTLFVSIHPFWDGNGRLARLLSNIPVLRSGYPPITIDPTLRREYIELLSQLPLEHGKRVVDFEARYPQLEQFIARNWDRTVACVEQAREVQEQRNQRKREHDLTE